MLTDRHVLRETADMGMESPYFLGNEIIGLSKDELPRPPEEIEPLYDWLDMPRPATMGPVQKWLRFWSSPRFTAKTYAALVWILCQILRDRNIRVIIQGEEKQMAVDSVMLLREWMEAPEFVSLYGRFESKFWLKDQLTIACRDMARKDPTLRALGLDVPMQGKRCDINLWDDLVGESNYDSDEGLKKVEKRVSATMPLIKPRGIGIYNCTRWSPYDMSTDDKTITGADGIIKQWMDHQNSPHASTTFPTWDCAGPRGFFGAYAVKGDEKFYPHAAPGELLYPTVLPEEEMGRLRKTWSAEFFASQALNDPIPAGTQYFEKENLQHFDVLKEDGSRADVLTGAMPFMAMDPASGKVKAAGKPRDQTAMIVGFIKWLDNVPMGYVVDWIGGVWKPSQVTDRFFNLVQKWKPRKIFVETNIGGEFIMAPLRNRAQELHMFLPLVDNPASLHGTGKKVARIEAMQEPYAYRQIWHATELKNSPGESEMVRWKPSGALHDDLIDVLAQWFLSATKTKFMAGSPQGRRASRRGFGMARRYTHTGM